MKQRLEYLHTLIRHFEQLDRLHMNCGKIYLYYDGFTGQNVEMKAVETTPQIGWTEEPDLDEEDDD